MRRILTLTLVGAGLAASAVAFAEDHCDRPMQDWRPREAVEAKARELGVEVGRIRTDDGCYKIYGRVADGRSVEIEMDPVTLKVLETEYRDGAHDDDHHPRHEDQRDAPKATQPDPPNPLIGPATGVTN